jgi:hypothetical protein
MPMYKAMIAAILFLIAFPVLAGAPKVDVEDGFFLVSGKAIPPACLQRLMTELNGDDVTRSIYLTRSSVRGCINSNEPGRDVQYSILTDKGDGVFEVRVCERVDGTMGSDCAVLIVQFVVHPYLLGDEVKDVLSLDKLGEK